ncbi:hypothetical protein A5821_000848 [Enterococcus sp. 7F3_DIV0205]|uniref:Uncharacterized protein n=1 Tax=Candidatus Enterococcus palustris TaxID=1834189 RepID=A0AAQ3Y565_9ENTE|nr:hypothetical protein [Enterococcus sp. 7F3_DIV0205]OTN85263.1 hypothetical protein A5821_001192 [Enterococcus sp. 7F3_DIV0205]
MLDKVLKDLKKNAQKMMIRIRVCNALNQKSYANREKAKSSAKEFLTTTKDEMISITGDLGSSIKGKFGKQVKETLKNQSDKLKSF